MQIISGKFISNCQIITNCTLDISTGRLSPEKVSCSNQGSLLNEEFCTEDNTYEVCSECHDHILVGKMFQDKVGNGLHEKQVCSDPECDSHKDY